MHLAVLAHHPLGSNQDRRIEAAVTIFFQHSHNQVGPRSLAKTCQELGGGPGNGFGVGQGFLQAVETVARQGAFGENHQSSLPGDGLLHPIDHPRKVGLLVHQGGVHLHPGQSEFFRHGCLRCGKCAEEGSVRRRPPDTLHAPAEVAHPGARASRPHGCPLEGQDRWEEGPPGSAGVPPASLFLNLLAAQVIFPAR